jgi:hypothetical protein
MPPNGYSGPVDCVSNKEEDGVGRADATERWRRILLLALRKWMSRILNSRYV